MPQVRLFLCCLFLTNAAIARGSEWLESNSEWFNANHAHIRATILSGERREVIPIINTIGMLWANADGAIGSEVGPSIADAMIYQPKLMFSWFERNPVIFDKWLVQIQYDVFTDYGDLGTEKLEKVRTTLIHALAEYIAKEDALSLKNLAQRVLDMVSSIKPRVIE